MDDFEEDAAYSTDDQPENSEDESLPKDEEVQSGNNKRKLEATLNGNKKLKTEDEARVQEHGKKKSKNGLNKPPTAEELNRLRETENLFNSNLFRLQIEELLTEVKVKKKYLKLFNTWFANFELCLNNLPEYGEVKLSELVHAKGKTNRNKFINELIGIHQSDVKCDQDVTLKFTKPEKHAVFGLHKMTAVLGPKLTVDVNITLPKKYFLEKDYLNNRLLIKRDYYLSYIYLHLKEADLCSNSTYVNKKAVLRIIPPVSEKIQVNVFVTPAEGTFKLSRFECDKNNIRENLFSEFSDLSITELKEYGTPFYNSLVLHDLTLTDNYNFAEDTLKDLKNVQDGVKLLAVWLRQRGLYSGNTFSESLLIQTVVYLTLKRKLNKHMSSYQVIRNVWVFLSSTNWHEDPISICEDVKPEKFKSFSENFDVVFLDKSGCYNLAAFLNLNVYMKIRSEAQLAVGFLDDVKFDSFRALFMTKMECEVQYDASLILKDDRNFKNVYSSVNVIDKYKYVGCYKSLIIKAILTLLHKGLNKRIDNIVPILPEEEKEQRDLTEIAFGITLNPNEAFKVTEKGPPSNSREAVEFTKFWGKLSECRRFADGSICEAVYFPTQTLQEKRKIFKRVIDFVATEKLQVQKYLIVADEFESVLMLRNYITPFPIGTSEEASLKIVTIFDELSKKLRDCDLPLEITSVQGASEVFSYTALFPPIPTTYKWGGKITNCKGNNIILNEKAKYGNVPKYAEPIECVIKLGSNSKWPHNLDALRHLNMGFYLELAKKLQEDSLIMSAVKPEYIDIFYQGLVFRFRLYNPREISALKKFTGLDGVVSYRDTDETIELEKNLVILPRIVSALHGVQSENPSYGPSTALIKRWLRSQLIDEYYISDIVIDLLNASLYLSGAPYNCPNLPQVAFLRFLTYIAELDWNLHLVIVNFNDELTKEIVDNLETDFQQNRQNYPPLCIITPYDEEKSLFTKQCSKEVLRRFSLLAKSSYTVMQLSISTQHLSTIKELFVPNLNGYNILINLKPALNPKRHQQHDFVKAHDGTMQIKEYDNKQSSKMPIVGFNPVEIYLKELRKNYGKFALFFYDPYGGNIIGVLWQPKALERKHFKVSLIEGRQLMDDGLILNIDAIIEDFNVLGNGLVKSIEQRN